VALNLAPATPAWLRAIGAAPMYLGLDLRGGVHFLMQVDTKAVMNKRMQGLQTSVRSILVDKKIRYAGIGRSGDSVEVRFRDETTRNAAREALASQLSELVLADAGNAAEPSLVASLRPEALKSTVEDAVQQNITTLSKRVNELGVAEPLIQRQGADRIVVQLPGVQDVSRAKDIIGRTATLEVRFVDETVARGTEETAAIPFGSELFKVGRGAPVVLYKDPIITGDYISNASASFDQNQQPAVGIDLNGDGGRRMREATRNKIGKLMAIVLFEKNRGEVLTVATIRPEAARRVQEQAVKQNITTLHNRINELGVSEPVIQQQGLDRIVVQLPGVQDTAKAKDILGRTATLEMRLVDDSAEGRDAEAGRGPVPFGSERYLERDGRAVIVKKQVIITGDSLTDAQPGFDSQNQQPKVDLTVDAKGGRIMRDTSRENLKKRMAILLFEKGKGEVLTAPVIQGELGNRFQISGAMTVVEANDLALLLRAGSLAAPMEIIEERTIGPSLGAENIAKGFNSVIWGFLVIVAFMAAYYMLFGLFSGIALAFNLLLLVAILSMLQATLTLPGMAAMALALGMAIDSNVLINERVREELRNGVSPQAAIHAGYDRAWATIFDSNITTLIAGLALLAFGSGPVRGFAVVHCIGILTSMFSAVFFSRGLVNLWYGSKKKLKTVSIGTVWRPDGDGVVATSGTNGR
jgi:preprotein translocase subunit SecD